MMMMSFVGWRRAFHIAVVGTVAIHRLGLAQSGASAPLGAELESRPALEAQLRAAEAAHRASESWLLKTRLEKGDFQDGDRIVVALLGSMNYKDTVTVRAGKLLPLPQMGDVPLEGVLRSELNSTLSSHIGKFLRDSSVRATPLLRLNVMGFVGRPGYYYTPADVLLNDVVMKAGGPGSESDMDGMLIRRSGEVIWNAVDTRSAMTDGISLERLNLRAGDELYVPQMNHGFNWQLYLSSLGAVASLLLTYRSFR